MVIAARGHRCADKRSAAEDTLVPGAEQRMFALFHRLQRQVEAIDGRRVALADDDLGYMSVPHTV